MWGGQAAHASSLFGVPAFQKPGLPRAVPFPAKLRPESSLRGRLGARHWPSPAGEGAAAAQAEFQPVLVRITTVSMRRRHRADGCLPPEGLPLRWFWHYPWPASQSGSMFSLRLSVLGD